MRPQRPEGQFSHWTTALAANGFWVSLFLIFCFHWWLIYALPAVEDELYYWAWSQSLQRSYFDHPPMVALWIALSTKWFGNSLWAIRFWTVLVSTLTLVLMARLMPNKSLLLYLLFTPLFFLGSAVMTPDLPLCFFWVLYLNWLVRINAKLIPWREDPILRVYNPNPVPWLSWITGGMLLGLGLLSKYTMLLALPCTFLMLATQYRWTGWFTGFLLHLVVGVLIFSPVIWFNADYDFKPFLFQWSHAQGQGFSIRRFLDFWGTQALLVGAVPLLFLPIILLRSKEWPKQATLLACFWMFLVPFLFFFIKSLYTPLEANWTTIAYLSVWPLAGYILSYGSFRGLLRLLVLLGFAPALLTTILLMMHWFTPFSWIPAHKDRLARTVEMESVVRQAVRDLRTKPSAKLFVPTYQLAAAFRFYGVRAEQLTEISRPSQFTLDPIDPCQNERILVFSSGPIALPCFQNTTTLRSYPYVVRDSVLGKFDLIEYSKSNGDAP